MIKLVSHRNVEGFDKASLQDVAEYFDRRPSVALDTETTSMLPFNGRLQTIQLGDTDVQFVIDASNPLDISLLKHILLERQVLAHNMKFDWKWMKSIGIDIRDFYDTFVGEAILTTGLEDEDRGLGLKHCVAKYTDGVVHKEDRGKMRVLGLTPVTVRYAAGDVKYLHTIQRKQKMKIVENDLRAVEDLEMRATRVLALMEYNGVLVDRKLWNSVAEETEANVRKYEKVLDDCARELPQLSSLFFPPQLDMFTTDVRDTAINWSSPTQKLAILKRLGFNLKAVDSRDLLKIRDKHKIIRHMIEYSKQFKLASSFGYNFTKEHINPATGLVHPDYFQIVSTGRISCSNPNLLNIPAHGPLAKKIRSAFVARPGYKIVGGDFSNFELRIIAEFAQDPLWDKIFFENGDLHTELCCRVFNLPPERVKDPFPQKPEFKYRDVQKTIDFGLAYGMSKYKLGDILDMHPDKAQKIIDAFFDVVPNVKGFLDELGKTGRRYGNIHTAPPFRRIRWFPKHAVAVAQNDEKILGGIDRAARNTIPQGELQVVPCINPVNSVKAETLILTQACAVMCLKEQRLPMIPTQENNLGTKAGLSVFVVYLHLN